MFKFGQVYMNEAGADGAAGGGGQQQGGDQGGKQEPQSPNKDWKDDPRLDENGNPKEEGGQDDKGQGQPNKDDKQDKDSDDKDDKDQDQDKSGDDKGGQDENDTGEKLLGTPVVQQVETLIKEAGLNPYDVAKIVSQNDGQATPEMVKAIAEKHGDAVASIVVSQLASFHKENMSNANKRDQAIYDQVQEAFKGVTEQGGKDTWKELAGWAKENVPNEERKEINKLLQQGGIAAKYAVDDLVSRFKSSNQFVQSADLVTGDAVPQDAGGLTPISQREYNQKFRELESKGHVYGQSSEFDKLDRQRMAGRNRGI